MVRLLRLRGQSPTPRRDGAPAAGGLAAAELGQGAVELAVEHGFVADELDEALLGGQGADEGSARLAEAVVPLGGFEFTLEAGDLGGVVVDDLLLGLRESVVEVRAGETGAVQLIEERVARVCLPAFQRVRGFGGDEA